MGVARTDREKFWQNNARIRVGMSLPREKMYQEYLKEAISRKDSASHTYQFVLGVFYGRKNEGGD